MKLRKLFKQIGAYTLASAVLITSVPLSSTEVQAGQTDDGYVCLEKVESVKTDGNIVTLSYSGGEKAKITFLEDNIFRFNMDPKGEFPEYPVPNSKDHTATIVQQSDTSKEYNKPAPSVTDGDVIKIKSGDTLLEINKETSVMKLSNGDQVVWEEKEALKYGGAKGTVQTLKANPDEYFYGGGTQNGRFSHKGKSIDIVATNTWVDGSVASPNPFYWSTNGYGTLRNTWKPGTYDFGERVTNTVASSHQEKRYDAYFFVDETPTSILQDYYKVTGKPVLYPEYGFYTGHLNCYSRDVWKLAEKQDGTQGKLLEDGKYYTEEKKEDVGPGETKETLNKDDVFSARTVIKGYEDNDMPMGWFLPNDGYGCGYGRTGTWDGNIENLKSFVDYGKPKGIVTGLWTESDLTPNPEKPVDLQRDFIKEVDAGVRILKTDVAWVGDAYSFALNGVKFAYDTIAKTKDRPTIVTLNGWGGTQRYGGIWTGDQYGGSWEYIRFHIPTYIGTGLSGQPNVGSDIDGIFGGSPLIQTRDTQWKAFTPITLNMDGWGDYPKKPYIFDDDSDSINRMYLKMKAELMPYNYTIAKEATDGKPMLRAMMLEYPEDPYTFGTQTQYQYMWGSQFLVAPVYQNTAMKENGDDIRNDIYLPDENQIWIDYLSGTQYKGGKVINNFDAPLWKLPIFVKNGSIIPMYAENNNGLAPSEDNPMGMDKTKRIIEFYPEGNTEFSLYEDDSITIDNNNKDEVAYGPSVTTKYTSKASGNKATLTAEKSEGTYTGYDSNRDTTFVVNVSQKPTSITGSIGGTAISQFNEVTTQEAFDSAAGNTVFYNESPNLNKYGTGSFEDKEILTTPKLYIKTEKTDVSKNAVQIVVDGFANDGSLPSDGIDPALSAPANLTAPEGDITPTSVKLTWDAVDGATGYEVKANDIIQSGITETNFVNQGLIYDTSYTYQVRAISDKGYSQWSTQISAKTTLDPYRNVPKDMSITAVNSDTGAAITDQSGEGIKNLIDGDPTSVWHTKYAQSATPMDIVLDMKKIYNIDKLEYLPRVDLGNGTLRNITLKYSIDGKHWKTQFENKNWGGQYDKDNPIAIEEFTTPFKARYLKIQVPKGGSAGEFGSGRELRPYKVNESTGSLPGDYAPNDKLDDADLMFFTNYAGINKNDATYKGYIEQADVNYDGLIDAYDIAFLTTQYNGGVSSSDPVSGKIAIVPDKTQVKEGENITLNLYGMNMKNVNAFSVEFPYDTTKYKLEKVSPGVVSQHMKSFSQPRTHTDGVSNIYFIHTNMGTQDLINGTEVIGKVVLKALKDTTWGEEADKPTSARLVGPGMDVIDEAMTDDNVEIPDVTVPDKLIPRNAFDVTFTNEHLATDDGNNHALLFQSDNFELLFDNNLSTMAEFKWFTGPNSIAKEVLLPTNFNFDFKEAKNLSTIKVHNRESSNGRVTSIKAEAYKGSEKIDLGTQTTPSNVYEFSIPEEHRNGITKVVVIPLTSVGSATGSTTGSAENRMLTLKEIEFYETSSIVNVTGIKLDESNKNTVSLGRMVSFGATIEPADAANQYYDVISSDPSTAKIIKSKNGDRITYTIQGLKAGTATITAKSMENDSISAAMEITVTNDADRSLLNNYLAEAEAFTADNLVPETFEALQTAIADASALAQDATQDQVDDACIALRAAIVGIQYLDTDPKTLINHRKMKAVDASSEATESPKQNTVDGNKGTLWHTEYNNPENLKLPAYVTIDLGEEYSLTEVDYIPRQDNAANGDITKCAVYTSTDNVTFTKAAEASFRVADSKLLDKDVPKPIKFNTKLARYVKFEALESLGSSKNKFASIGELQFYGTGIPIPATGIEVLPESMNLNIGDSQKAMATLTPYDTTDMVTWSSSDTTVATVDENGIVTAVSAGSVTITASANETVSADISVTIKPAGYDDLAAAITVVENYVAEGMEHVPDAVKNEVTKQVKEAKVILAGEDTTEQQIADAYQALMNAYNLANSEVIGELGTLISESEKIELTKYDLNTHEAFTSALNQAKETYADLVTFQIRIMDDYTSLLSAKQGLVSLDGGRLSKMIELGNETHGKLVNYADGDAKNAFVQALAEAKTTLASIGGQNMAQSTLEDAATHLMNTILALEKKQEPVVEPEPPVDPEPPVKPDNGRWVNNQNGWWYDNGDGTYPVNQWKLIGESWYYFDTNGYMRENGWVKDGNTWFYLKPNGSMQTGWVKDGSTWYYTNNSGAMQTGWFQDGPTWYYANASGVMQTGWVNTGSAWYFMNDSGAMQTGWTNIRGTWYYMNASGVMQTGWINEGGTWYYTNANGAMQTGWLRTGNAWYHLKGNGAMSTGWTLIGGTWYYLNTNGAMQTGWLQIGSTWYYLRSSGAMVTGSSVINGRSYTFNASGAMM